MTGTSQLLQIVLPTKQSIAPARTTQTEIGCAQLAASMAVVRIDQNDCGLNPLTNAILAVYETAIHHCTLTV